MATFKFELGDEVREKVTGLTGIVMGRTEYSTGCLQYGILPRSLDEKGEMRDWKWLDEERLTLTGGEPVRILETIGGPQPTPPSR